MRRFLIVGAAVAISGCQAAGPGAPAGAGAAASADVAPLSVAFADPAWNGSRIPDGQQCSKFGGDGATPAMTVTNVPEGTAEIVVEINDESYQPLSYDGGHGTLAFAASPGTTALPSVPGETSSMPAGVRLVSANRATGDYAAPGYLPPCSGGRNNLYSADVMAVDATGTVLAAGDISLGRY